MSYFTKDYFRYVDDFIKDTMFKYQIFYKNIDGDVKGYDFIVDEVMEKLNENEKESN